MKINMHVLWWTHVLTYFHGVIPHLIPRRNAGSEDISSLLEIAKNGSKVIMWIYTTVWGNSSVSTSSSRQGIFCLFKFSAFWYNTSSLDFYLFPWWVVILSTLSHAY